MQLTAFSHGGGFSLDGSVRIEATDRAGLERLIRYCARPPFALNRLHLVGNRSDQILYLLPRPDLAGRTALRLSALEFLDRLARILPPPRIHRHRYHGVFAPNAPLRPLVPAQTISVQSTVAAAVTPADLELGTTPVSFAATVGGASPVPQVVSLNNFGGGALGAITTSGITYGTGTPGWLAVSNTSTTVTLTPTTGALTAGTHAASLTVWSVNGGSEVLNVSFRIGQRVLTLSSATASFNATVGGASPAQQTVTITNTGAGSFADLGTVAIGAITFVPSGTTWLTATGAATGTLTLTVATGSLAAGTYTASVPVLNLSGGNDAVDVSFTVAPTGG